MNKKLVLIGPPGSGKGTISDILINEFNLVHISTGNSLREAVRKGDDFGKKLKVMMDSGELISDEIVDKILKDKLSQDDVKEGFILDGYPRNMTQAEKLIQWTELDEIVIVDISDEAILERLKGRRTCPKCGASYHIKNIKPKVEGICDVCGTELVIRTDEDKIKHRLDLYHKETEPVIDFFQKEGIRIKKVPGDFDIETEKSMIADMVQN